MSTSIYSASSARKDSICGGSPMRGTPSKRIKRSAPTTPEQQQSPLQPRNAVLNSYNYTVVGAP
jgi:hypothetical protein